MFQDTCCGVFGRPIRSITNAARLPYLLHGSYSCSDPLRVGRSAARHGLAIVLAVHGTNVPGNSLASLLITHAPLLFVGVSAKRDQRTRSMGSGLQWS